MGVNGSSVHRLRNGGIIAMPRRKATKVLKIFDALLCKTASVAFDTIQFFNKYHPNPSFTPKWSDKPLLKSWEKTKPTLGWPRQTDSLCPGCVKEAREEILSGKKDWRDLIQEKVGEIKAQIIERNGQVWMVKQCPKHGQYEDLMAMDSKFLAWIEKNFPGREDRKSTRLNSSHLVISYAVFCLKKKTTTRQC